MYTGSIVALVTPLANDGVDTAALARLVRFHLDRGTHGIVPVGTTGEAPTLSVQEHKRIIEVVVHEVAGQVPVIAGAGSNNTLESIELAEHAGGAGADAVLHAVGYYNRPNQEGIFQHFKALDQVTRLPIVVYNVPPRSVVDILPDTMGRLAQLPNVVGVKDATRDLARPLLESALIRKPFSFLSGEDPTAVAYNANGGVGCISVTANVAPELCAQMQEATRAGRYADALNIQRQLMPLHEVLFMEPSPAGIKYACSLLANDHPELGQLSAACRLPMVELTRSTKARIQQVMGDLGLIEGASGTH